MKSYSSRYICGAEEQIEEEFGFVSVWDGGSLKTFSVYLTKWSIWKREKDCDRNDCRSLELRSGTRLKIDAARFFSIFEMEKTSQLRFKSTYPYS